MRFSDAKIEINAFFWIQKLKLVRFSDAKIKISDFYADAKIKISAVFGCKRLDKYSLFELK
jgi:hypothetical protein